MTDPAFSDETLMAFADGELDDTTAAALLDALERDADLSRRLDVFLTTRAALAPQAPPAALPAALQAQIEATLTAARPKTVVPFARKAAPPARAAWQPLAAAASVALALGLGAGFWAANTVSGARVAQQASLLNVPNLNAALGDMASGETRALGAQSVTVVTTFRDAEQILCREVALSDVAGQGLVAVLCHDSNAWQPRLAIATTAPEATGYAPASSLEILDSFLDTIGAGAPLSDSEEAAALGQLATAN